GYVRSFPGGDRDRSGAFRRGDAIASLGENAQQRGQGQIKEFRAPPYGINQVDYLISDIHIRIIDGEDPFDARRILQNELLPVGNPTAFPSEKTFEKAGGYVSDVFE